MPDVQDFMQQDGVPSADINKNIAETLSDEKLTEIGSKCLEGFENDLTSRDEWETQMKEWVKLAKQVKTEKTWPWPNASNVKYPLLSTAAMQFSARAYPALVPSDGKVVKTQVIGYDDSGQKHEKAEHLSTFMSWQVMYDMPHWEEDMDKMLIQVAIIGCLFKKTFFDKSKNKINSILIHPECLVVNNWTKCLEETERISEIIELSPRIVEERKRAGIFLDIDLGTPVLPETENQHTSEDSTTPYTFVEQHTFLDLDNDDYPEPVVVTFERNSGKVVCIYRRYLPESVEQNDKGKIIKIVPTQMYTKFGFLPNPDGSFYDIGLGALLGPINESVNTLINQLVDSGTLNNLQSGFIGKGLRIKMGDASFTPGEWKPVNATGDDLRKQIVPLPAKEPSNVLFELMGTLITSGKELASVAEIFTGKMPGQNTPATTTMATVEQGMKVFTAVYKRIYRSLGQEFKKIFQLNKQYLDPNTYVSVLDKTVDPSDFDASNFDVVPSADPTVATQQEKLMKAQALMEMMQTAGSLLNPVEIISRVLQAQEQPNWEKLLNPQVAQTGQPPAPPPDPKVMAIQAKMQADQQKLAIDAQSKQQDMEFKSRDHILQMQMQQQKHAQDMAVAQQDAQLKAASEIAKSRMFLAQSAAQGQQQLHQSQQTHEQKLQQSKEQSLTKASSKSGNATPSRKK